MNCPRCGESNPNNYKFCGMCGANLQAASQASEKPASKASSETSHPTPVRTQSMAFSRMESRGGGTEPRTLTIDESRPARAPETHEAVEPIAGPSLLGLNQPTPEMIRETTFQGMTTYYPEERHPAWGRIFLTLIFIVGLVALGWWRYKNYGLPGQGKPGWLSAMNKTTPPSDSQTPEYGTKPATQNGNQNGDQSKSQAADQSKPASGEAASTDNQTGDSATAADKAKSGAAEQTPDKASAEKKPVNSAKTSDTSANEDTDNEDNTSAPAKATKTAKATKAAANDENSAPPAKLKPAAASAEGDGLFRKGESYLYGRGVAENCGQAIRYLKSASDKSSAKARSTFGTMYATGHCVPRDLPTSYRWFALALQADPSNSILEKDLSAIWNQMTPPERQLATKLKPNGE